MKMWIIFFRDKRGMHRLFIYREARKDLALRMIDQDNGMELVQVTEVEIPT